MADFSALKTAIQANIRTNGNEEITGAILQDILLSMVSTMGDGAINALSEALQTEITNRQNAVSGEATTRAEADSQLSGRINAEAQMRGEADTQLSNSITAITTRLNEGYVYAGIATPSTNPGTPAGKVFYIALQAGTYTNFSSLTVTQGINILKYNGTAWSQEQLVAIDDVPTAGSNNLVKSGGVFSGIKETEKQIATSMGEGTNNLVSFPLDITQFFVNSADNKIYTDGEVSSIILPIDSSKGDFIVCQKLSGSKFQVSFLRSLTPQIGDSVISMYSFAKNTNKQVMRIPDGAVGILFWYYYEAQDLSVQEVDIRNSLCVSYSVLGYEKQVVPYGFNEFLKAHDIIDTHNLRSDIVENVFINKDSHKMEAHSECYSFLVNIADVSVGETIFVHRKYTGSFGIATFGVRPIINSTTYIRMPIANANTFLTKKEYSFEKQEGENFLVVWFYYNTNIGTPDENYRNIYIGTVPFNGNYNKYINKVNRETLDYNEYSDSPIDYSIFTSGQANTPAYITDYIYKTGFVKSIKTKVNSEQDSDVTAYIINSYNNVVLRKYMKTGHGELEIDVNEYIGVPFYLAIKGKNLMYESWGLYSHSELGYKYFYFYQNYNCGEVIPIVFGLQGEENITFILCQQITYASLKDEIYKEKNTNCRNRLFVAGDSITAGHDSYTEGNHWWEAVCRKYNMIPYPAARTGAGFSFYNGTNACKIAKNYDFSDIDVAIFAFGTNDYGSGNIPIGTINDTYTYSEDSSQTFFACMKYVIETVKSKNPNCTLIFSLPINRSDKGTLATRYGYGTQNGAGYTLLDYCNAMIQCCDYYCIPYIDNRRGSFDLYSLNTLLYDRLHPSILGYKVLGSDMIAKFGAIYQPYIEYDGKRFGYGRF